MENLKLLTSQLLNLCSQQMPTSANGFWQEHLEIRKIVDEIRQIQKTEEIDKTSDRFSLLPDFLVWCDKAGIKITEGVVIEPVQSGLGLACRSSKPLELGQLLIQVPSKSMMTLENAKKSDLKRAFSEDPILQRMENVGLSIFVLNEKLKSKDSYWYYYIGTLPTEFSTPMYFDLDELQLLKGSQYFEESLKLWRNISRQYAYFYQLIAHNDPMFRDSRLNLHNFTFDLYRWATAVVMTRLNLMLDEKTDNKNSPVLIPFWDMANHDSSLPMCTDFDDTESCGKLFAGRRYAEGEEICIFYGPRSNGEFFLHNGFVVENESRDNVAVRLGLTKSDPLFTRKENLLRKLSMSASQTFNLHMFDTEGLSKVLFYAVVFNSNENHLEAMTSSSSTIDDDNVEEYLMKCDDELLKKARNFLKVRLQLLIKSYTTVTPVSKSDNSKLVLNFVQREKKVLSNIIDQL